MSNTTISPNMNLPIPNVGVDPGPDYAVNVDNSFIIVDQHNHTSGSGVLVPVAGLNINTDFPLQGFNLILARSLRFSPQGAPLSGASDLGCLYESGVDLYYNDGNGNQIRITQGGSVAGASGTITGLPSGTASASYSAGTFVFEQATDTAATLDVGSIILRNETSGSFGLTLSPPSAMGANYDLVLPALPSTPSLLQIDTSGNITAVPSGVSALNPAGSMVAYAGSTVPTGYLLCDGSSYLQSSYPELFAVIGTTYGSVDSSHFSVPNMIDTVPVGQGGTIAPALGNTFGEINHVLTVDELAQHNHSDAGHVHPEYLANIVLVNWSAGGNLGYLAPIDAFTFNGQYTGNGNANIQNTGSSDGHNTVQPSLGINWIIKT